MAFLDLRERLFIGRIPLPLWAALGAGALGYFLAAQLGLGFASAYKAVSPIWPASGLAIALLLQFGLRMWPAVAVGAFVANALVLGPGTALIVAGGNTLEAVVGALILRRVIERPGETLILARTVGYVLSAGFATVVSATIGVFALLPGRRHHRTNGADGLDHVVGRRRAGNSRGGVGTAGAAEYLRGAARPGSLGAGDRCSRHHRGVARAVSRTERGGVAHFPGVPPGLRRKPIAGAARRDLDGTGSCRWPHRGDCLRRRSLCHWRVRPKSARSPDVRCRSGARGSGVLGSPSARPAHPGRSVPCGHRDCAAGFVRAGPAAA